MTPSNVPPELFSGIGCALSVFLASVGACWASIPSGVYATHSNDGIKGFAAIIISGVLAIYGIIVAAVIVNRLNSGAELTSVEGYMHLSAGLSVGLACLASGGAIAGFVDRHMSTTIKLEAPGRRADSENEQTTPLIPSSTIEPLWFETSNQFLTVLVFIEAVGLYGLVAALLLVRFF
jgi:ATP synthase proteolipid subunit